MMSNGLFGNLLDGLFNRVDQSIKDSIAHAKNAAIELEIETARELSLAIENAKNAYKDSLDYTIDKVSQSAQKAFNQLDSMVQKFEQHIDDEMDKLMLEAQQLVNSLPLTSKQPQVTRTQPRYLVVDDVANHVSLVIFKGNFPCSAKKGFEPTLTFSNRSCPLANSDTQSLTFQVPQAIFKDSVESHYSFQIGALQVPWDDGWLWSHKTQFDYKVCLGAIPKIAGKGFVEFVSKEEKPFFEPKTSEPEAFDGNKWYPEHWHETYYRVKPEMGWSIDTTQRPILHAERIHGDPQQEIISVSPKRL